MPEPKRLCTISPGLHYIIRLYTVTNFSTALLFRYYKYIRMRNSSILILPVVFLTFCVLSFFRGRGGTIISYEKLEEVANLKDIDSNEPSFLKYIRYIDK